MVCVDNSKSMHLHGSGILALTAVYSVAQSLARLEVGEVGIVSFGSSVTEVRPLTSLDSGLSLTPADLSEHFKFNEQATQSFTKALPSVLSFCSAQFEQSEALSSTTQSSSSSMALIITDGRFNKDAVRPLVRKMISDGRIPVLIVLDSNEKGKSIFDIRSVTNDPLTGRPVMKKFLDDDFPFPYYAVINDSSQLPNFVADVIKQWFEANVTGHR